MLTHFSFWIHLQILFLSSGQSNSNVRPCIYEARTSSEVWTGKRTKRWKHLSVHTFINKSKYPLASGSDIGVYLIIEVIPIWIYEQLISVNCRTSRLKYDFVYKKLNLIFQFMHQWIWWRNRYSKFSFVEKKIKRN